MDADPTVAFVAKILALFVAVELAQSIAPQAVIIAAGLVGAIYSLMDWAQSSRMKAIGYILFWTTVSWLFAYPASAAVAYYFHVTEFTWMIKLSAVGISGVGHRWPLVAQSAKGFVISILEKRASQ